MKPESVGLKQSTLVLGKHSGRHALQKKYQEMGYNLTRTELDKAYKLFIRLADRKKEVFDEDLLAIVQDGLREIPETYTLRLVQSMAGNPKTAAATVILQRGEEVVVQSATGDGPVAAAYVAIDRITGRREISPITRFIRSLKEPMQSAKSLFMWILMAAKIYWTRSKHRCCGRQRTYLFARAEQSAACARTHCIAGKGNVGRITWLKHCIKKSGTSTSFIKRRGKPAILYVDCYLVHEVTSPQAFEGLRMAGRTVRTSDPTFATAIDHNVPTWDRSLPVADPIARLQIETLERNCREFEVPLYGLQDPRQGIVHVIGPDWV